MIIKVVDFEKLTSIYKPYLDGIDGIEKLRDGFKEKLLPIKDEMQELIKTLSSGVQLLPDQQAKKEVRYSELQEQAVTIDDEYKVTFKKYKDDLNYKTFNELSAIIDEYIEGKEIDMVIGKMEIVFVKPEHEITEDIIDLLKTKNLSN